MKLYKNLNSASKEREGVQALKITIKEEGFPQNLLDFPNLGELYLEGNCKEFPRVPTWTKLKVLSIKWPVFSGDLSNLFYLPALENLKIIETPMKSFKLPLGHAASPIKSLTVKDCDLLKLPEEICMLEELTELNLSGNKLEVLPASFIDLKKLKRLNLDGNKFSEFPTLIQQMPQLTHLSIDGNKFSEEEKTKIYQKFHIWIE